MWSSHLGEVLHGDFGPRGRQLGDHMTMGGQGHPRFVGSVLGISGQVLLGLWSRSNRKRSVIEFYRHIKMLKCPIWSFILIATYMYNRFKVLSISLFDLVCTPCLVRKKLQKKLLVSLKILMLNFYRYILQIYMCVWFHICLLGFFLNYVNLKKRQSFIHLTFLDRTSK